MYTLFVFWAFDKSIIKVELTLDICYFTWHLTLAFSMTIDETKMPVYLYFYQWASDEKKDGEGTNWTLESKMLE
jgi:hypothetical protein